MSVTVVTITPGLLHRDERNTPARAYAVVMVKRIGFLSFGHYQAVPGSLTRTAADVLQQSIDLAVAAEEVGVDGAYFRVHHFARQLASPFPLLAAIGARTTTHRDRHRRHRHALREPAVHGRGGRRRRPDRRRQTAARHQPRITRDGAGRLRVVRLRARRTDRRTPTWPARTPSSSARRSPAPGWRTPTRR